MKARIEHLPILRRPWALIVAIGLVALVVRLVAIGVTPDLPLTSDPAAYDNHARTILATGGYPSSTATPAGGPSAVRPPAYPYFLAGVYAVSGESVMAGRIAQAVLGAIGAALVALVALELFGLAVASLAGLLAAFFPPLVMNGMTLFTEPLFVVLLLAAVLGALRWRVTRRLGWVAAAGGATGLALLTRPNALALLVVLALAVREGGRWRSVRTWRAPALLVACAFLVVAPWTIRNAIAFDRFVPVTTTGGFTAAGTYNETSRARDAIWIPANLDPAIRALIDRHRDLNEAALSAELDAATRRFALEHPGYVLEVAARNALRLFNLGGTSYERAVAQHQYGLGPRWAALMTWSLMPVLLLAAAGAATRRARAAPLWVWAIPLLLLSTVFVLAANRHRAAIDPFLLMLAALAVVAAASRIAGDRAGGGTAAPRQADDLRIGVPSEHLEADPGTGAGRVWSNVLESMRGRGVRVDARRPRRGRGPDVWLTPGSRGAFEVPEPVVAVVHGAAWPIEQSYSEYVPEAFSDALIAATEATVASATIVIVPSEYTRRGLVAGCGISPTDVHVVPHGVDSEAFSPTRGGGGALVAAELGRELPYVLFASTPSNPQKNLPVLQEAMGMLAARGLPHALVIAGGTGDESPAERAAVLAEPPGMQGRVLWLGHVDDGRLAALMAGCAAFCLPSLFESFGLTALEAMACGAPVVVANRGALPEVVGDAALTAEPTAAAMAAALDRVLTSESLAAELGAAGRARGEAMTWDRTAAGWLEALRAAARPR